MLITIFAYMKNRFPRHSARTVGSPTRSPSPTHSSHPYAYCANNPVNKALGEVEPGEPTKINHFGTPIIVGSPNSTEPISSPEIIYKMETK